MRNPKHAKGEQRTGGDVRVARGATMMRFGWPAEAEAMIRVAVAASVTLLASRAAGQTVPPELSSAVPADVAVALFYPGQSVAQGTDPAPTQSPAAPASRLSDALKLVAFLSDRASHVGLLSNLETCSRMWLDTFAALPVALEHPLALALFDARAEARSDGGHKLAGLHAALILHTRDVNEKVERRIQHLLNTYTNTEATTLADESTDDYTAFILRDRRLPEWASITWGRVGDYFAVTVGDGTYEHIVRTIRNRPTGNLNAQKRPPSLATDAWFAKAVELARPDALTGRGGRSALGSVTWLVQFNELKREADASLTAKIAQVQTALGLGRAERGLWTAGRTGRAVEIRGVLRRDGRDEVNVIAGAELAKPLENGMVPEEATGYAVLDCNPRTVLRGLRDAYLASRSPHARQSSRAFWRDLEDRAGVSIEQDVFANLGGPLVIHDYPPHPLRVPFAWTILLPIDGDAETLRRQIDRFMTTAQSMLGDGAALQFRHDAVAAPGLAGGLWYIQYGLVGPALTVTDRWLVISFSPQAVRQNVEHLRRTSTVRGDTKEEG